MIVWDLMSTSNPVHYRLALCNAFCRRLFSLRESAEAEGGSRWQQTDLCMGDSSSCIGSLVGQERERFVLAFGEDEDGELYILTTSRASSTDPVGVVYHIVDPSRYVMMCSWLITIIVLLFYAEGKVLPVVELSDHCNSHYYHHVIPISYARSVVHTRQVLAAGTKTGFP